MISRMAIVLKSHLNTVPAAQCAQDFHEVRPAKDSVGSRTCTVFSTTVVSP